MGCSMSDNGKWAFTNKVAELIKIYGKYLHTSQVNRCSISSIEKDEEGKNFLLVLISGIKVHLPIKYYPEELVTQDDMLRQFSQRDVRAITYLAIKNQEHKKNREKLTLTKQEFYNNKTIFVVFDENKKSEIKKTALQLYADMDQLHRFDLKDVINIVSTAVQEQLIEDFE
jgi:hypothetical protein